VDTKTVELGGKEVGKVFCIDGHTYAADGKAYLDRNRHIWKRNSSEDWETIFTSNSIVLTMTGFSENDLYTSGLGAETWHFSDGAWAPINLPWQADSSLRSAPTINSSTVSPNGDVFLAGRNCLFQGRGQEWRFIDLGEMANRSNRVGQLTWFKNKLYFSLRKDSGGVGSVGDDGIARPLLNNGKQVLATSITSDEQRLFICESLSGVSSFDGSQWS